MTHCSQASPNPPKSKPEALAPPAFFRFWSPIVYHSELRDAVLNLRKINARLRATVPSMTGFSLAYQPQVDRAGKLAGAETLLRWDPQCGHVVGPNVFIPALERSRMIVPVGEWVLEQSLAALVSLRAYTGLRRIAVNVSARQLSPGFVDFVLAALQRASLTAANLTLELTESQAVADTGRHSDALRALADAGVTFEIDDFGTGYASMRWLRKLRFSGLKIDRSLLIATDEPPGLLGGICSMAHAIGMTVTAEGVETDEQWQRVTEAGVDYVQGYLTGKPMSLETFTQSERVFSGS